MSYVIFNLSDNNVNLWDLYVDLSDNFAFEELTNWHDFILYRGILCCIAEILAIRV